MPISWKIQITNNSYGRGRLPESCPAAVVARRCSDRSPLAPTIAHVGAWAWEKYLYRCNVQITGARGNPAWQPFAILDVHVTLWLIDWIGLGVDLHMHIYCTGFTCIPCPCWAWDWAALSRNCRGQRRCNSTLTATIYCSHNNNLAMSGQGTAVLLI